MEAWENVSSLELHIWRFTWHPCVSRLSSLSIFFGDDYHRHLRPYFLVPKRTDLWPQLRWSGVSCPLSLILITCSLKLGLTFSWSLLTLDLVLFKSRDIFWTRSSDFYFQMRRMRLVRGKTDFQTHLFSVINSLTLSTLERISKYRSNPNS